MLISLDFYGTYLHWYVNRQKKLYTHLGGALTITSFIICFLVLIYLSKDFLIRNNPQTTENDDPNSEYKKIKFGEEKIYIPWTISDYQFHKVNFTGLLYPVIYYFYSVKDINTGELSYNYKKLNYSFCNKTNIKSLKYKNSINIDIDNYYCIDMDNINMGGDYFHDFYYYIQLIFYYVKKELIMRLKEKNAQIMMN